MLSKVLKRARGPWVSGTDLHPAGESMLATSEQNSVVFRDHGEVAGWMLHHILGPGMIRRPSLWIRPELVGQSLGIPLAIEPARRHRATSDRLACFIFMVIEKNDPMHRFVARRLQPAIVRSSFLKRSEKLQTGGAPGSRPRGPCVGRSDEMARTSRPDSIPLHDAPLDS